MYKRKRISSSNLMDNSEEPHTSNGTRQEAPRKLNPTNEATLRALKNITSKKVQCEHHIALLDSHLMNGTSPKGLTSTIQPNVPCADTTLLINWEKIKLDFQAKLLVSLNQYWQRYLERLEVESTQLSEQLKANTNQEEWTKMTDILGLVSEAARLRYSRRKDQKRNTGRTESSSRDPNGESNRRESRLPRREKAKGPSIQDK
jgi:hypothetical protein